MSDTNLTQSQGLATAGLVLGILGVITSFIPCFGFWAILFGILSIIFGGVALSRANKSGANRSTALTGLILGIVAFVMVFLKYFIFVGASVFSGL